MISFPFDSHVTYTVDGTPEYDRAVTSEPYRNLIKNMFTTGVNPKDSAAFQVGTAEGMNVAVTGGFAIVEGMMNLETETRTLAVQVASSEYDRIDSVVLRLDDNDDVRTCDLYVVKGTPAETPTRPALTRAGSIYEIGLADLFIGKNSTSISAEKITDTRFEAERCGVVAPIAEIDTTTLNKLMEEYQKENQASFESWVASLKDILDEETAGHLQTEIEALQSKIDGLELTAEKVSYDDTSTSLGANNVQGALEALKKSVSDGKSKIASAITAMGVSTSADATFSTMAGNIKGVSTYKYIQTITCTAVTWYGQSYMPGTTTINIATILPNKYKELTANNFKTIPKFGTYIMTNNRYASWAAAGVATVYAASISYNSSTGVLSIVPPYIAAHLIDANSAATYYYTYAGMNCDVYYFG